MTIGNRIIAGYGTLRASRVFQALILLAAWKTGDCIARFTGLPVPGGILGMLLVLALLVSRRVDLSSVKKGSDWLLADMLLFFVPAVLAVLNHREFLGWTGVKIMVVILAGTLIVMACTAFTIELCMRWNRARGGDDALG